MKRLNFNSEKLVVDWVSFKFQYLESAQQKRIIDYLFKIGFNSYYECGKLAYSQKEILKKTSENKFEVLFVNQGPYWDGTLLHFSGKNAARFYLHVKQGNIDFQILSNGILSRFDLHYNLETFIDEKNLRAFFQKCQNDLQLNVGYEKNRQGQILKIGNRRSNRYSRIYYLNNTLRFEHEMKGRFIQNYSQLLMKENSIEFENKLSEHFLLYFWKYLPIDSPYLTWLAVKLRSIKPKHLPALMFKTDYIGSVNTVDEKKKVIKFLQFLVYAKELDYQIDFLGATSYRCISFRLAEFIKVQKPNIKEISQYQLKKFREFFTELQTQFLLSLFDNESFQSLISIPKVEFWKQDQFWICKVWIIEDLFYHNYPFALPDIFPDKISKIQFLVRFEVVKIFSSATIEKKFFVKNFIECYPASLSNKSIKQIKEFFVESIETLKQESLIQPKFKIIRNGKIQSVKQLTYQNISEGFVIYEQLTFI
jgi:hypothetical protein